MAAEDRLSVDSLLLHPAAPQAVDRVIQQLQAPGHPFEVFDAYRSPQRQAWLYAQRRTRPGAIVKAKGSV